MLKRRNFSLKFGLFIVIMSITGAVATTPFSQYGMIQNVQNYSGNPFYNPNNATVTAPKIVYANGPSLKAGDCERVVQALVENECEKRKKCKNLQLSDIRPSLMIQLSTLPSYNYAASCAGYIDTAFEQYMKLNHNVGYVTPTATFPTTTTTQKTSGSFLQPNLPKEQVEYNERAAELKQLQAQNNNTNYTVTETDFPKTVDDLGFLEKIDVKTAGYEKYKDAQVYVPIEIERSIAAEAITGTALQGCEQVYACITKAGQFAKEAETTYLSVKPTFGVVASAPARITLTTAVQSAILSACTCTEKLSNKAEYRKILNASCDDNFSKKAQETAIKYADSL